MIHGGLSWQVFLIVETIVDFILMFMESVVCIKVCTLTSLKGKKMLDTTHMTKMSPEITYPAGSGSLDML
jgi:hypothetical protein